MKPLLVTSLIALLAVSPAFAQDKAPDEDKAADNKALEPRDIDSNGLHKKRWVRVVPSGVSQGIGFFVSLNPDCTHTGETIVRITKQPEHGSANVVNGTHFPNYPKDSSRFKCNSQRVKDTQVHYKSADKYVGNDTFEVLVIYSHGIAWEMQYEVSVR
jgi:hypothetical protein